MDDLNQNTPNPQPIDLNSGDIKRKVEDMGVIFEKLGRTPMSGRVFAYLLLANPHYQPFDQIVAFLGASKSAISNALALLQQEGSVSYVTFSGDRKRYFKIDTDNWLRQLITRASNLAQLNDLLKDVYAFRSKSGAGEFDRELLRLLDFQKHLSEKVDAAIAEWNCD